MSTLLRYLRNLVAVEDARKLDDRALLRRFAEHRDGAAFAVLVDRHAPLVLAACRRLLPREQDAEDVLQATFLVLVRKAGSVRRHESVGSFLYGTAYLLARKARAAAARRKARERAAAGARPEAAAPRTWDDLGAVLDEELAVLPDKYRAPILLCGLQGKTRDEAARELGWSPGAVKIRLERGRELLRTRLTRRGVALPAAFLLTTLGATAAVPARLAAGTVDAAVRFAAGEAVPTSVARALADGLLRETTFGKLGLLAGVSAGLLAVGLAAGSLRHLSTDEGRPPPEAVAAKPPAPRAPEVPPAPEVAPPPAEKPPREPGATVAAVLRGVQPDRGTVTVRVREVDTTYPLAPGTDVRVDGRPAGLTDLRPQFRAKVTFSTDGSVVVAVAAEGPAVAGVIRAADPARNTLTVAHAEDSRTVATTWPVALDAAVRVGGRPATLADLRDGLPAAVQLSADRKRVVAVTADPP